MFSLNKAGLFRANPEANRENVLRLVDADTPGTPGTDSATLDLSGATLITGIQYTGKDGNAQFLPFTTEDQLTQKRTPYSVAAGADLKDIQDAISDVIKDHEVDAIVSVTGTTAAAVVEHTGAGTISALVVDGSNANLSRAAISGVSVGVQSKAKGKAKK